MKLGKRMECILREIDGDTLADIGCDHGKLICSAILSGKIKKGFAVDISKDSLDKAKKLSVSLKISDKISFFVGDGQEPIKGETIDCTVIAGMGATEIVHILSQGKFAKKYILCPHQDAHILRKYLQENCFAVLKDYWVYDKKYYPILVVTNGQCSYENQYFIGKNIPPCEDFIGYITWRKQTLEKIEKKSTVLNENTKNEWMEIQKWLQSEK